MAVYGLSPYLSPLTCFSACAPFTPSNSGQRLPPTYYRGCWHVVSRGFLLSYRHSSSLRTEVYNPKTVFPHAALLHQAFAHCAISPTAASRRSLGRVSVPMWPFNLSVRLPIVDLVSRYLANYLIGRESILQRIAPLIILPCDWIILCGISVRFQTLSPSQGQVTHALLTRPPLSQTPDSRLQIPVPSLSSDARSLTSETVRLACVRHAASVRPEPGSNSLKYDIKTAKAASTYLRA